MLVQPKPTRRQRLLRSAARGLLAIVALGLLLLAALWWLLRAALLPAEGDWAVTVGRGPWQMPASVPQLVWLATTPWIGEQLAGWRVPTRAGPVTFGWVPAGAEGPEPVLTLHCEPCTLPLPAALGQSRLTVAAAQIALSRTLRQEGQPVTGPNLRGTLLLAAVTPQGEREVLRATWNALRQGPGWGVTMQWREAPLAHWLALAAPGLPELRRVRVDGSAAATVELQLPQGTWQISPRVQGLAVSGLGTEAWAHVQSSCGPHRLHDARGWLARAVLAAEDQRFYEHPGYDLEELLASFATNQQRGVLARGGSTITQQLAKLMVAGDERTLTRKLRELLYAAEIEQTLGKARILQLYLNMAPWGTDAQGRLVCGADAAARHWFGVPARRLEPGQAVTLAAMLHNPQHESALWAREGSVDKRRMQWIAQQVRGVPVRQRRALAARLQADPAAPQDRMALGIGSDLVSARVDATLER